MAGRWLTANVNWAETQLLGPAPAACRCSGGEAGPEQSGDSTGQWAAIPSECGSQGSDARFKAFYLIP